MTGISGPEDESKPVPGGVKKNPRLNPIFSLLYSSEFKKSLHGNIKTFNE
jgi:hypothetical protein